MASVPYSLAVNLFDLVSSTTTVPGGIVTAVRVDAGYAFRTAGGTNGATEEFQSASFPLDFPQNTLASFTYTIPSTPYPSSNPTWSAALVVQEVRGVANGTGWLFRSGTFPGTLPTDTLEIITAEEVLVNDAGIAGALPALPNVSTDSAGNVTTLTAITTAITGPGIALTAVGTDSRLPAGVTFTFTCTLNLVPSGSVHHPDQPFLVVIASPAIAFTASPSTGFVTALLNAVSGMLLRDALPSISARLSGLINAGVLAMVTGRLGIGAMTTLPGDVILSIRAIRGTTQALPGGGTEPVIGVLAAVGAFGGVANRLRAAAPPIVTPPPPSPRPRPCFIATAATHADHPDVVTLRHWRDTVLVQRRSGPMLIGLYDRLSPPVARAIARHDGLRRIVRRMIVAPAAHWARRQLD